MVLAIGIALLVPLLLSSLYRDGSWRSFLFPAAATLNVIGPGPGHVGASESFEIVDPFGRAGLTVCMLLGRLELFTVLALLSPAFWGR